MVEQPLIEGSVQVDAQITIDKAKIADSFSRAAGSYDRMAVLQRRVGQTLLNNAAEHLSGEVMDLGCGTGYFSPRLLELQGVERVLGVDLAEGMLAYAREHRGDPSISWIRGDAEQLPLEDQSIDSLFTSLSIQWCENLPSLFAELSRVLKPGGVMAFATLGPDTLYELRESWAQVDDFVHVNRFQDVSAHTAAIEGHFEPISFQEQRVVLEYRQLKQLTDELKGIGAHNLNAGRITGLAGRQRIMAFRNAYETFRNDEGMLPATYQVYFGLYIKR